MWKAAEEREVVLNCTDGSQLAGRLLSSPGEVAVLARPDGTMLTVPKAEVEAIRIATSPAPTTASIPPPPPPLAPPPPPPQAAPTSAAPIPASASEAAFNPDLPKSLGLLLKETDEADIARVVRTDGRFRGLKLADKELILQEVREDRRVAGFLLNLLVGFGVGSFYQGDTEHGTSLLINEAVSAVLMIAGYVLLQMNYASVQNASLGTMIGGAMLLSGGLSLVVTRIGSILKPLGFQGRKYRLLKSEFGMADAQTSLFLIPSVEGGAWASSRITGAGGSIAVRF